MSHIPVLVSWFSIAFDRARVSWAENKKENQLSIRNLSCNDYELYKSDSASNGNY